MSTYIKRQVVLDTETTGMKKSGIHYDGHRIIEIGATEIINRRLTGQHFHVYLKPDRLVDPEAFNVHGISDEFLADKPTFSEMADEFLHFICDSELIIHNAPFDIGFIDYELSMLNLGFIKISTLCKVTDSLLLARKMFPGKRNSLDALCARYLIDNSKRKLHSALLDAKILANIFLLMTSSQAVIRFAMEGEQEHHDIKEAVQIQRVQHAQKLLKIIYANKEEVIAHKQHLSLVKKKGGGCLWWTERSLQKK